MSDTLEQIGKDYWEWVLRTDPAFATYIGDFRYNDRLADISAQGLHAQRIELQSLLSRARSLPGLAGEDAITADILSLLVESQIGERSHGFEQWNLDQLYGPQVWLQEVVNYQPLRTLKDHEDLAARYRAFGPYVDAYVDNLQRGIDEDRLAPDIARDRVAAQLRDTLDTPVLASPLLPRKANEAMDAAAREKGTRAVLDAVEDVVYPAFRKLLAFLEKYPARSEMGIWAVPGGEEAYAYRIRKHTTTDMTADRIHQLGLEMLASLHDQMREVARRVTGSTDFAAFNDRIRQDPANFFHTREQLLDECRALIDDIDARLGQWFLKVPAGACEVKAIEEFRERDAVAAYYYPPSDDFSRSAVYYVNTFNPHTRPRYNLPALTAHEAIPGHHLQIALAMEQRDLPDFRRYSDFTAYIEGWALYAERLAGEMGIYQDSLAEFGMLTYQAWRATRLVVDTGIHAMKWDRAHAISFFLDSVCLPEDEIVNEVDRYIVWPGQALAYAVGMSEILRLRAFAEERLGARFGIREFHDAVLRGGALPLRTLDKVIANHVAHVRELSP